MDEDVLVYYKNIESVYENYEGNINLSIMLLIILSILFLIVSYVISKLITIPLNNMTKEMDRISNKDYNIIIPPFFEGGIKF